MGISDLYDKKARAVFDALGDLEVQACKRQRKGRTFHGNMEVDATALRKMHVSCRNEFFARYRELWCQKHPGRPLPKYFLTHIRIAGILGHGGGLRVSP